MLADAPGFKRQILDAKHQLEMEYSYRTPPSPPFRAAPSAPPAPAAPGPPPSPLAPPGPAGSPSGSGQRADATEITQTLARLADLRDRGAITPEEYEAKKADLLARL